MNSTSRKKAWMPYPPDSHKTSRRCMWGHCASTDFIDKWTDICFGHATIISDHLHESTRWIRDSMSFHQARLDAERAEQEAENKRRIEADQPIMPNTAVAMGVIYYLLIGEHIKIGYTRNLYRRITHYPPTAELLGVEHGTKHTEARRHEQFHAYLAYGREWFRDVPEIRGHITRLTNPADDLADYRSAQTAKRGPGSGRSTLRPKGTFAVLHR